MTTTRVVDADGLGAKTRQLDVRSSASIEVEAIRASGGPQQVNDALELAQVAERVDHRSYARQGVEMEPTVKMGHASAAIERRAQREQIAAGQEPHAVTPRGQMNEAIEEKRGGWGSYLERGREWLQEMGAAGARPVPSWQRMAWRAWCRVRRGRCGRGCKTSAGDGFDALPALDQSPRQRADAGARSWISRGRPSAIGSDSKSGNDSAGLMGRISASAGSVRPLPRLGRARSGRKRWRGSPTRRARTLPACLAGDH